MPKIQWTNLPPALRRHLFDRLEERKITVEDLYQPKLWREAECLRHAAAVLRSTKRVACQLL